MTTITSQPLAQELEQIRAKLLSLATGKPFETLELSTNDDDSDETLTTENLDFLCQQFGLSESERQVLLLCIAVEMIPDLNQLCAHVSGQPQKNYPTLAIVQKLLSTHAPQLLSHESALQQWQLIQLDPNPTLGLSPIRIDPAILSYILGYPCTDPYLKPHLTPIVPLATITPLPPSQQQIATELLQSWQHNPNRPTQLIHPDNQTREAVALSASTYHHYQLYKLHYLSLPTQPEALHTLILRWQRHIRLYGSILLLECSDLDPENPNAKAQLGQFIDRVHCPVILSSATRLRIGNNLTTLEIPSVSLSEQKQLWTHHLGEPATSLSSHLNQIVTTFNLTPHNIEVIARTTLTQLQNPEDLSEQLWLNCRNQTRSQLESFAQRIDGKATWGDLVLPNAVIETIKQIIAQMKNRHTVYEDWGLASNNRRGLGLTALFYGASGTGKTTAAEIIAHTLNLDLYRVDLSQVVSKYIGETEKNLSFVFAAAESAGAVLQFDEADSIIGKRSDVKDARDRYANQEVGYVLQRLESYSGLAILTTNLPNAMDSAFERRIRFSVRFEMPNQEQRTEIWRRLLGHSKIPVEGLNAELLGQLNFSGASIRMIAENASFLAVENGTALQPPHMIAAARSEAMKLGRGLTDREIEGWPR
jgi:ATPase family associated with various cellular activities (AAA)